MKTIITCLLVGLLLTCTTNTMAQSEPPPGSSPDNPILVSKKEDIPNHQSAQRIAPAWSCQVVPATLATIEWQCKCIQIYSVPFMGYTIYYGVHTGCSSCGQLPSYGISDVNCIPPASSRFSRAAKMGISKNLLIPASVLKFKSEQAKAAGYKPPSYWKADIK